jgi:hypothetical protein
MSIAKLERLKGMADRMRYGLNESGKLADSVEVTMNSFERNLAAVKVFHDQVRKHDSDLQNMLKDIGNFDPSETPTPAVKKTPPETDLNGITLNPDAPRK